MLLHACVETGHAGTCQKNDCTEGCDKGHATCAELARAVAAAPAVLILDEPAAGLNADEQAALGDICRRIADAGSAVLLIDHNVDFLRPVVTRLACMDAGRIIAAGAPEAVLADPGVRAAYLGSLAP